MSCIFLIPLKILWRMAIKSNPLRASHAAGSSECLWISIISDWTAGKFGTSHSSAGATTFKQPGENLAGISVSWIRYCAWAITKPTYNPEPSSAGSGFCRWTSIQLRSSRHVAPCSEQPHSRFWPVARTVGERTLDTPQRDPGFMRKPASSRTQV